MKRPCLPLPAVPAKQLRKYYPRNVSILLNHEYFVPRKLPVCQSVTTLVHHSLHSACVTLKSTINISYYPRHTWAATGIVVCLFVTGESIHLGAIALRLQHGYKPPHKLLVNSGVKASLLNKSDELSCGS